MSTYSGKGQRATNVSDLLAGVADVIGYSIRWTLTLIFVAIPPRIAQFFVMKVCENDCCRGVHSSFDLIGSRRTVEFQSDINKSMGKQLLCRSMREPVRDQGIWPAIHYMIKIRG